MHRCGWFDGVAAATKSNQPSCGVLGTHQKIFGLYKVRENSWPAGQQEMLKKQCSVEMVMTVLYPIRKCCTKDVTWSLLPIQVITAHFNHITENRRHKKSHIMATTVNKSCPHRSILFLFSLLYRDTILPLNTRYFPTTNWKKKILMAQISLMKSVLSTLAPVIWNLTPLMINLLQHL